MYNRALPALSDRDNDVRTRALRPVPGYNITLPALRDRDRLVPSSPTEHDRVVFLISDRARPRLPHWRVVRAARCPSSRVDPSGPSLGLPVPLKLIGRFFLFLFHFIFVFESICSAKSFLIRLPYYF